MNNRRMKSMKAKISRKNIEEHPEENMKFSILLFATLPLAVGVTGAAFMAILACAG